MPIEIIVPRLGWSMEEGAFVAWHKNEGDLVKAGDRLFSIEGDKAVQEIESIDSGILRISAVCPKPGDPVRVGDVLGHLLVETDVLAPEPTKPASRPKENETIPSATPIEIKKTIPRPLEPTISPRARRLANELGIEWRTVSGTGRTGRIRERDIRSAAQMRVQSRPNSQSTVLVTGGCGFIGTWVLRELRQRGLQPIVLDCVERPARWNRVLGESAGQIPLVHGTLLNRELLRALIGQFGISHIIHLAALLTPACNSDPFAGCEVNVLGTVALFEEARRAGIKGISYASSAAVFGHDPDRPGSVSEEASHPVTFYGAYKKAVELIAEQYWRQFKLPSVGIRPQVAYGPERDAGLTAGPSLAARAAARGESFTISYTGAIGYDYAEDAARAFVRCALETPPGACGVDLPGEVAGIERVIAAIEAAIPNSAGRIVAKGPALPNHIPPHPCYINALFPDWQTTSLNDGIARTVAFYAE